MTYSPRRLIVDNANKSPTLVILITLVKEIFYAISTYQWIFYGSNGCNRFFRLYITYQIERDTRAELKKYLTYILLLFSL